MNTINIGSGNRITGSVIQSINGEGVSICNRSAFVNGKEYPFLPGMRGNSTTIINNKIFVDGYELTNKGWKKTLRALWNLLF